MTILRCHPDVPHVTPGSWLAALTARAMTVGPRRVLVIATSVSRGVWEGGEDCCAVLPRFFNTPPVRRTVQSVGKLWEAEDFSSLSETPGGRCGTEAGVEATFYSRQETTSSPDRRRYEQSIQRNDRPEVPAEAPSRYGHHPQWVEQVWRRSCWVLTL